MSLMNWKDEFSVKINLIDQQHKKLIELINRLHDGMKQQRGKEVLSGVLGELVSYTESHFLTEERLMTTHQYPGLEVHRLEHTRLVKKVADFQKDFQAGRAAISIDVMNFLREWLEKHILGTDKRYSSFFAEKGVQ